MAAASATLMPLTSAVVELASASAAIERVESVCFASPSVLTIAWNVAWLSPTDRQQAQARHGLPQEPVLDALVLKPQFAGRHAEKYLADLVIDAARLGVAENAGHRRHADAVGQFTVLDPGDKHRQSGGQRRGSRRLLGLLRKLADGQHGVDADRRMIVAIDQAGHEVQHQLVEMTIDRSASRAKLAAQIEAIIRMLLRMSGVPPPCGTLRT